MSVEPKDFKMVYDYIDTPFGELLVAGSDKGLTYATYSGSRWTAEEGKNWIPDAEFMKPVKEQLVAYFAGELKDFELTLDPMGTSFQLTVWEQLRKIPYGETRSYGELAVAVGNPKASRAVGSANGRNPIVIIQPCHRVIGASGKLTGFAYGLQMKRQLLGLEEGVLKLVQN